MGDHNDGNGREERRPRTFNPVVQQTTCQCSGVSFGSVSNVPMGLSIPKK